MQMYSLLGAKFAAGEGFEALTEAQQQKVAAMNTNLETFMNADRYVFVTPMWNFSYPPVVKAYLDNVAIAGKTFKYTENGPVGLLEGKKALHIQATGGVYSEGAYAARRLRTQSLKNCIRICRCK